HEPSLAMELVALLSEAAGGHGMVAGQVMDISTVGKFKNQNMELIHQLKTSALIRVAIEGAAVLAERSPSQRAELKKFGAQIGYAFQLADDILDFDPESPEPTSYASAFGVGKTKAALSEISVKAHATLTRLN